MRLVTEFVKSWSLSLSLIQTFLELPFNGQQVHFQFSLHFLLYFSFILFHSVSITRLFLIAKHLISKKGNLINRNRNSPKVFMPLFYLTISIFLVLTKFFIRRKKKRILHCQYWLGWWLKIFSWVPTYQVLILTLVYLWYIKTEHNRRKDKINTFVHRTFNFLYI